MSGVAAPMVDNVMGNESATTAPDAQETPALQRRLPFARMTQFEEPSLSGLFALLRETLDRDTRVELSGFARERLRAAFPAGSGRRGEVQLANGLRINVDVGDSFGAEFAVGHLNESDLLDAVTANIPDGAKIVDVGANFGLYALHSAWAAGPASRVVAFEPLSSAGGLLLQNVDANALSGQITFVASAVGARRGKANFYIAEDGAFSGLHDTKRSRLAETIEVPVVSLDASPEVTKLGAIDFLKVDVEGHEGSVLAGARKLMERSEQLLAVLEFSHKNLTETGRTQIISALQGFSEAGFQIWLHDDKGVRAAGSIADELGGELSATIILAAEGCSWIGGMIASLEAFARRRARSGLAYGLQPLMTAVRDARRLSSQAETLADRYAPGTPAPQALQGIGQLLGQQQAQLNSMSARVEGLEGHTASLQAKLDERLAVYQALAEQRAQQEAAFKAALEQRAADLASTRERADRLAAQVEAFRAQSGVQQANAKSAVEAMNAKLAASREREAATATQLEAFRAQFDVRQAKAKSAVEAINAKLAASREREAATATQLEAFRAQFDVQNEKLIARTQVMESAIAARHADALESARVIDALKSELSAESARIVQMEAEMAAQTVELETRWAAIRQLQQREALLKLGKLKS